MFTKKIDFTKVSLIAIATLFLWVKTNIAYVVSFDIKIENWIQQFILIINPLSSLLFVFGIAMFLSGKKHIRYIFIASVVLSIILYANVVFYRVYTDFLTLPLLFQTSNMSDLGSSVKELIHFTDILYFIDIIVIGVLIKKQPKFIKIATYTKWQKSFFYLLTISLAFFNLSLAETQRTQLLTRTFDREILVKNIGAFNYQLYDIFLQTKATAQRALADGSELTDLLNYNQANYTEPSESMFGIAKGKNIIMISLESTQSFVVNREVNGEAITPYLNEFIKDSLYFENFYHQTGQGKTSDSEFIVENSLYPLGRGAVFFTHSGNEYQATPEILNENGYYTASLHANNKSFWNRDIMYKSLGYQRFYEINDYEVNEENSVGWGLKDIPFFEQSIDHLKEMPQPFYTKFITLTNHFPFELEEEDKYIEPLTTGSKTLNNYIPTVRYQDEALKIFIERLKEEGLYENSVIVLYGDHYGISDNHNKAMAELLGEEVTPFVSTQLQRVPFVIHIPGMKGETISTVSGQMDIKPTLLHLLGVETKDDIQFGSDLFSTENNPFVVLRDGSFITEEYVYTTDVCYDRATGEQIEQSACTPLVEQSSLELQYSDSIINGDLLRFYDKKSGTLKIQEE
ncbi:LTA synthase family protein [Bacillus sp. B1-b2]|uniref:LTA synthase family protein n=1 Tax=Bacillus sp. B1-b2 TaxID=2653201 RepID=UPI001261BD8C|nr:LTA synthase family protein [Bacillus sp. B1-b2]KAB7670028.1 LTA synthase family protein [Bacillus sp. B1-b2]